VIAGVCSGIAVRSGIDPVIVRIFFVLLFGALFWLYLLLWIVVPSQSIHTNITRRLYRNPDDRLIAGVCGGLAVYFKVDTWVPRLIFAAPLLLSLASGTMHAFWWHWGMGPRIFTGSLGSTLFVLYVILWIALPYASNALDKMEMRGERIDMNSIKANAQANAGATVPRRRGGGIGRAIGILFKAFFLFIAGIMALGLFGVLIGLFFAGMVAVPFTDYMLSGVNQHLLLWTGVALFLGIPLIALITWAIRRLTGVRSHKHYLGYIFTGLWFIGLISVLCMAGIVISNFRSRSLVENSYPLAQPSTGKLYVNVSDADGTRMNNHSRWFGNWKDDNPFYIIDKDSLWMNTVKVNVTMSTDSLFHMYETRISRGSSQEEARRLASHLTFDIAQMDSVLMLPNGFAINSRDKFRNQQVLVVVEVPVGGKLQFNDNIDRYDWFTINVNGNRNAYMEHNWYDSHRFSSNDEYLMTASGLINTTDSTDNQLEEDDNDY
jgi:phage shock protein PspC (stress-responsive transcriptional regulator)